MFQRERGKYPSKLLTNGDTPKPLPARSGYLLFQSRDQWKEKQKQRASILFELYPDLEKTYNLTHKLSMTFSHTEDTKVAYTKLARWFNDCFDNFSKISNIIFSHYSDILNFFENKSTIALQENHLMSK
ncbi:transposase [Halosquirtibacter xylanolyticus]|uniref:transposase n=1 Tax=Halosquirtibacter xylanolyticus TaxID=3374599 RepID=UPI003747AF55|nr:transposase [Prolixibacteraceae bacterium]